MAPICDPAHYLATRNFLDATLTFADGHIALSDTIVCGIRKGSFNRMLEAGGIKMKIRGKTPAM
jgi:hypothetical protein